MNRILLCFALFGCTLVASSQKVYFIYVQADPSQPFYLKLNEKVYSSTTSGYLILSRLRDSTYTFSIGFPGNKGPEQKFTVPVEKKDHGYLLKNFGEKGWGLFDLQTMAIQMAAAVESKKDGAFRPDDKAVSDFTNILSKAADDPTLKEKPVVSVTQPAEGVKTEPVPEKTPAVVMHQEPAKDPAVPPADRNKTAPAPEDAKIVVTEPVTEKTPVIAKTEPVTRPADDPSAKEKTVPLAPEIIKPAQASGDNNKDPVAKTEPPLKEGPRDQPPVIPVKENSSQDPPRDPVAVKGDTSQLTEPVARTREEPAVTAETGTLLDYKPSVVTRRSESSTTEGFGLTFTDAQPDGNTDTIRILIPNAKPVVPSVSEKQEPKDERRFLDPAVTDTLKGVTDSTVSEVKIPAPPRQTNNCPGVADENDFLKLRKRMAAESSDDNMIAEAKKWFRGKCFSVQQVRNLGLLFLNDKGKYEFFDAAYLHVSDPLQFPKLVEELKDEYYINRFKAMLRF